MASVPPKPADPDNQPGTFPGADDAPAAMIEPGDPGDAPSDSPTKTQA